MITTVSASVLPPFLRLPYIDKGYRQLNKPWLYYFRSIFQIHNESINIWTHALAVIVVVFKMLSVYSKHDLLTDPYMRPLLALLISVVILYVSSSLAHCFHSRSEIDHYTCFMFDYSGIGIYCLCAALAEHFYSSEEYMYITLKSWYMPVSVALGFAVSLSNTAALARFSRHLPITQRLLKMVPAAITGLWAVFPSLQRIGIYFRTGNCNVCLNNHVQVWVWMCLAGVFYVSEIPERVFHGWCNYVGTGHQCFHVLVMMMSFNIIDGVICDIDNRSYDIYSRDEPTFGDTLGTLVVLGIVNLFVIIVYRQKIK